MRRLSLLLLLMLALTTLFASGSLESEDPPLLESLESLKSVDPTQDLAPNQLRWIEETTVSLLTVGTGDPLHAWFGHSALIITQPSGSKIMYDWGIFDANQDHFYFNFARGRMYYYVLQSDAQWRINEAIAEGRDVRLIDLHLPPAAQFAIIEYLQKYIGSVPVTYLYHFYDDNCATRIRDIINMATDGAFKAWAITQPTGSTIRSLADTYMMHRPLVNWILSTLQGPSIDQETTRWEAMFLPLELERAIIDFSESQSQPIVKQIQSIATTTRSTMNYRTPLVMATVISLSLLFTLQLLGLIAPRAKRTVLALAYLFLALLGSVLLFMMVSSDMDMTWSNLNIITVNPLLIIPALFLLVGRKKHSFIITLFLIATTLMITLSPLFGQANISTSIVLFPLYLSGAAFKRRSNLKGNKGDMNKASSS